MTREAAMKQARLEAIKGKFKMVVVHAPIEMIEDANGDYNEVFGYCPDMAKDILFSAALKGLGQTDCPAQGIVATFNAKGNLI